MAFLEKSKSLLSLILSFIKVLTFITNIFIQIVFFIFYIYSICNNVNNILFLIIYSVLLAISVVNFITYSTTFIKHLKKPKKVYRAIRISKYTTNATMLILNTYEMIYYGAFTWDKIFLLTSAISLGVHIVMEISRILLEKYLGEFSNSIKTDIIPKRKEQLSEAKYKFYKTVDKPLQSIAHKLDNKTENNIEKEEQIQEKSQTVTEIVNTNEGQVIPITTKERTENEKNNIAKHFGMIKNHIFKKKKPAVNKEKQQSLPETEIKETAPQKQLSENTSQQ